MSTFRGIRGGEEQIQEPYLRIPESILSREDLCNDSKLLFGLIITRTSVTQLNDERGFLYIYLSGNNDPKTVLGFSKNKLYKALQELEQNGLIERKRVGFGNNVMIFPSSILPEIGNNDKTPYFPESGTMKEIVQNSEEIVQNSILPENGKYDEKLHTSQNQEVCKSGLQYSQNRDSIIPENGKYIFKRYIQEKNEIKRINEKSKHIEEMKDEKSFEQSKIIRSPEEARRLYWADKKLSDDNWEREQKKIFGGNQQ